MDHLAAGRELIQVVRPRLHHLATLRQVRGAVVGAPVRIAHGMGQLVLDQVRAEAEDFIQYRPRQLTISDPW